jgi:hypothetical protein
LDLSNHTQLTDLNCSSNQIAVLDVSKNINLVRLQCHNPLSALDVSKNTKLTLLYCQLSKLTTINLTKNPLLNDVALDCNYYLITICVNNVAAVSNNANFRKDATASWSQACAPLLRSGNDAEPSDFAELNNTSAYPNPFADQLTFSWNGSTTETYSIELINALGTSVYVSENLSKGIDHSLMSEELPAGNYILRMSTPYETKVMHIIKK